MRLLRQPGNDELADDVDVAGRVVERLIGLIGRRGLPKGSALIIPNCKQVHTFGVRFPIDVVFSDRQDKVVGLSPGLKPCRLTRRYRHAAQAIELPAGTISEWGIIIGDKLTITD